MPNEDTSGSRENVFFLSMFTHSRFLAYLLQRRLSDRIALLKLNENDEIMKPKHSLRTTICCDRAETPTVQSSWIAQAHLS